MFDDPSGHALSSTSVAGKIDEALAAVRDAEAQREAMDLPRPGEWDAAQCDAVYRCGYGAFERGDFVQAIECFAPLLSACPLEADYAVALALSMQRQGEPEAALPLFMAAALMDQDAPGPMYRVGECLIELRQFDAASQALKQTMARCGGEPRYANVRNVALKLIAKLGYLG
ncbi:tetratricopeptide repeat protein [Pandoraea aquatica]|nr:tetratricopeptide repeat protein [Pandoraea aquatica]